jgi:hypothetical protein
VVDFGTFWAYSEDAGSAILALGLLPVLVLAAMFEHFQDTEDFTSEDGVHVGPSEVLDESTLAENVLLVLPMSEQDNIYRIQHADLLRLRAFPGKWGGHDGLINHSGPLEVKTSRYFRKLLASL